jgi:beta-mannanase
MTFDIQQADLDAFVNQMKRITVDAKRQVLVRLSPEMNGNWNNYGQQPARYIEMWKRIVDAVRAQAKDVAFIWSPSSGEGYPYGGHEVSPEGIARAPSAADMRLLDTNNNGVLDAGGK